ncbi:hypothetical protein HG263_10190 [Pseudoalteromonas sp. JBTF-M23]|uniref:Uncharacterized protein n=1 Tax=Pseudoalteromonas caenipelagi TaxID=2726988 RepID=A0A849VC18_9GAMM|nr:hypothetical protein [Pseudoalteromonas caenipelagi]NOU50902.1 hypothetical protein [Pseudoalteromonas caenipelagi]
MKNYILACITVCAFFVCGVLIGMYGGIYYGQASLYSESFSNAANVLMIKKKLDSGEISEAKAIAKRAIQSNIDLMSFLVENRAGLSPRQQSELDHLLSEIERNSSN